MITQPASPTLNFIKEQLSLPDGRRLAETLPQDPWLEERVFRPVLALDEEGLPLHRLVYIELARGHAKTSSVAEIALTVALEEGGTEVYTVAADLDQARLLAEAIRGQLRRNLMLARAVHASKDEFTVRRNGSRIRVMSSDVPSAFGIGPDARRLRVVCDELSQWPQPDLYHAMATALPKTRDSQMIIISNAGVGPGHAWQWDVREAAREHGYLFTAEGTIASWIRPADLEHLRATVPPPIFARYHENRWIEESGEFVTMDQWDQCLDLTLPPLPLKETGLPVPRRDWLVIGCDAAVSGDSWAAVAVSRAPGSPKDAIAVRDVAVWAPPSGGTIDFTEPWRHLEELCKRYRVMEISYDPYQLFDFMRRFQAEHTQWCEPFDQGAQRAKADSDLCQLIRSGRLSHDGNPELRAHVTNAGFKVSPHEDTRARLVKRTKAKIDAAVALSMAASECLRLRLV